MFIPPLIQHNAGINSQLITIAQILTAFSGDISLVYSFHAAVFILRETAAFSA